MRPTSLFVLGAAGLSSFVSGQTTTLTSTETGSVSSYTSATTVFPSSSTTTSTVTPAATSPLIFPLPSSPSCRLPPSFLPFVPAVTAFPTVYELAIGRPKLTSGVQ
ncbi:hypothetical protein QBC36DRAFT_308858 [Triangularia setosa]|uniref:Uncharacterized protein n=1 Tax=Triangularia setosa TaxID=2587417 RepID=A0AAN6WB92_9PEZI|nr:hypothetical protein QBC36DRAFT_308858 [Podospora setosa]